MGTDNKFNNLEAVREIFLSNSKFLSSQLRKVNLGVNAQMNFRNR